MPHSVRTRLGAVGSLTQRSVMVAALTCTVALSVPAATAVAQPAVAQPAVAADVNSDGKVTSADLDSSITEIQAAIAAGRVTSEGLVRAYLARIAAVDKRPRLGSVGAPNAMITENPQAISEARQIDRERSRGGRRSGLYGIPVILKDNIDTAEMPTTAGCLCLRDNHPQRDAVVVQRLRADGAIILGKANMDEFAVNTIGLSSLGGLTTNAYSPVESSGGSSAGSAVAEALDFAPIAFGTDTGGSIRIPSAWNSLVGVRPSLGTVSRTGVIPLATTQDTVGPIARTVDDAAIGLAAIAGPDPTDPATSHASSAAAPAIPLPTTGLRGAVIGLATNLVGTDPTTQRLVEQSVSALERAGAVIRRMTVNLPSFESGSSFEMTPEINRYLASDAAGPSVRGRTLQELITSAPNVTVVNPRVLGRLSTTDSEYQTQLARHQAQILAYRGYLTSVMDAARLDAIIYPTTPSAPIGLPGNNIYVSPLSGLPAVTVPMGYRNDIAGAGVNGPAGIEFLGREFADTHLLELANGFQQVHDVRVPPTA